MSRYDIVLYGASGFTGAYVLKLLVEQQNQENVSFAIAGRNEARLKKLLENMSQEMSKDLQNIPIIIANSYDESTLATMAKQAKVIINVVGPYRLYGEAVVKAAMENGASYVDISGEPAVMRYCSKKGLYVVGACGWDSIPCDLGVNFLKNKFNGQLNHVETFAQLNSGPAGYSFNAGTYRTLVLGMASMLTDGLGKIRRSIMPERLPKSSFRAPKRGSFWFNDKIDGWCLPFYGSDKSVVTRSQYFDYKLHNILPVQVETFIRIKSIIWAFLLSLWLMVFMVAAKISFMTDFCWHTQDYAVKQASFTYWFFGTGWTEKHSSFDEYSIKPVKQAVARCMGPDAGYIATSACVLASAVSLLNDADKLPQGGVYTPTAAFKDTGIYGRLEKYGIRFEIVDEFQ
ncbi:Saccharopine dehydrogenase-like oxidoreductase [Dirofilaria immitis]|nr:Saccharopine dehydrogenase-like oxidoreductase [Dirofilaria immitis]